jgi:CHRD domain
VFKNDQTTERESVMFNLSAHKNHKTVLAIGALTLALCANVWAENSKNFVAVLSGADEVPSRDTSARGVAIFQVNEDQTEVSFRLIVANIENVVAAHIHLGPEGEIGPVVAFLAGPFDPAGGRVSGPLAVGTITAADLLGPLAGMTISDLVAAIVAGDIYTNVHTNDGVDPTDEGPGDFPSGEIRGQLE